MTAKNTNDAHETLLSEIEAFEAATRYDATYMKEMLEHAPEALLVFNGFLPMANHRLHAPLDVYQVAKLAAFRHCDCGPCFQLALDKAKAEGLEQSIRETIAYRIDDLEGILKLAQDFTLATPSNASPTACWALGRTRKISPKKASSNGTNFLLLPEPRSVSGSPGSAPLPPGSASTSSRAPGGNGKPM